MKHPAEIFQHVELGGPDGDCWEWKKYRNPNGFGVATSTYPERNTFLVHRMAYKLANPTVDIAQKEVCHTCNNNCCCNPSHLFLADDTIKHSKVNSKTDAEREAAMFKKVELGGPNGDCWEWQGATNNKGYGMFTVRYNDEKPKNWLAHRLAYKITHPDEDITDKVICHKCDNPCCCNPDHLFSGTQKDNIADCVRKGRYHKQGKLTEEQRAEVRSLYATGDYTAEELGRIFRITAQAVYCLVRH